MNLPSINDILVDTLSLESAPSLVPAMESLIDMAVLENARITLEGFVEQFELADGNIVDVLNLESKYKQWLADEGLTTPLDRRATGPAVVEDVRRTLAALQNPSMESNLVQQLKRTFNQVSLNLKTFGKNLFEIKTKIKAKGKSIESNPVLISGVDSYRFLTKDDKPVQKLPTSLESDIKFIDACEVHYKALFEKSTEMSKRFRSACISRSVEVIREAIDYFDESLLDRNVFQDLTKFRLLGNRVIELDGKGYPKISKLKGGEIKFSNKAGDASNLVSQIASGGVKGFSIGGAPKAVSGVAGFKAEEAQGKVAAQLQSSGGVVAVNDFIKLLDRAQIMNQESVRFAQMAASMNERVGRLADDLTDAYNATVQSEEGVEFDHVVYRELLDLHKSARRSVSQYMFLGKLMATIMEDHSTFVYRGITTIANQVLSKAKDSKSEE